MIESIEEEISRLKINQKKRNKRLLDLTLFAIRKIQVILQTVINKLQETNNKNLTRRKKKLNSQNKEINNQKVNFKSKKIIKQQFNNQIYNQNKFNSKLTNYKKTILSQEPKVQEQQFQQDQQSKNYVQCCQEFSFNPSMTKGEDFQNQNDILQQEANQLRQEINQFILQKQKDDIIIKGFPRNQKYRRILLDIRKMSSQDQQMIQKPQKHNQ